MRNGEWGSRSAFRFPSVLGPCSGDHCHHARGWGVCSVAEVARAATHSGEQGALARVVDFVRLSKPGVAAMVLATCVVGALVAPVAVGAGALARAVGGTALLVASANALNMWMERDLDARMARTRLRPLADGRLPPAWALGFAAACAAIGLWLSASAGARVAALGGLALVSYVGVYTPLKRRTWLALYAGMVPGALPPAIGWVAATGRADRGAWLLFGVLALWQLVHAAAIGVFRAEEYACAGMHVPATALGPRRKRALIAAHAVALVGLTLAAPSLGLGGPVARVGAAALGIALVGVVLAPTADASAWARRVFGASNAYLLAWLAVLLLDARLR